MSIWTFDHHLIKAIAILAIATGLSACGGRTDGPSRTTAFSQLSPTQKSTIEVSGRPIIIEGPRGFCMDRQASQIAEDNAFVLLGNCNAVSTNGRGASPKIKALLTATISGSGQGSVTDSMNSMDAFFRSETGRTALSRSSDPGTVQILDSFQQDDVYYLRARDSSTGIVPDASDDYWRAYFDLRDQIVSVSVIGFQSDPISPDVGLSTVQEFTGLIRNRNDGTPMADTVTPEPETPPARQPRPQPTANDPTNSLRSIGLLRRLLG